MSVSYDRLWKKLIDRKMKKIDLMREAHISSNALAHLSKGESVSINVIEKICEVLQCTPNDILEFPNIEVEESETK